MYNCRAAKSSRCLQKISSKTCKLTFMLGLTLLFFVVEIISGFLTRSVALVADSAHMLSDSGALLIALFSVRVSKRKSSKNTFGWVRAEVLGALVNAVFLLALCVSIIIQAIKRFVHFEEIEDNFWLIIVGVIGLVINLIGLIVLHGDGHGHHHHHHHTETKQVALEDDEKQSDSSLCESNDVNLNCECNSHQMDSASSMDRRSKKGQSAAQMNMRGVILHVFNDALGSVVVIISGLCIRYIPDRYKWKHYFDPIMSMMMVTLIVGFTAPLLKESAMILLQTVPTHIRVTDLQQKLLNQVKGVLGVHEFHIWQLSGQKIIASAHIRCQNLHEYMRIAEDVKRFFHNEGIHSTTIQPEFVEDCSGEDHTECILECMLDCSKNTCCGQQRKPLLSPFNGNDGDRADIA